MVAPSLLRITWDELLLFEILLKQVSLCEYIPILSCNTRASIATCRIGQADMVTVDGLSVRWMTITIILTMTITINIILTKKIDQHCDFGAILHSCHVFLATSGKALQHVVNPPGTRSLRDAVNKKKRDFLGIFPKCRAPPPLPPFWEKFPKNTVFFLVGVTKGWFFEKI